MLYYTGGPTVSSAVRDTGSFSFACEVVACGKKKKDNEGARFPAFYHAWNTRRDCSPKRK